MGHFSVLLFSVTFEASDNLLIKLYPPRASAGFSPVSLSICVFFMYLPFALSINVGVL